MVCHMLILLRELALDVDLSKSDFLAEPNDVSKSRGSGVNLQTTDVSREINSLALNK